MMQRLLEHDARLSSSLRVAERWRLVRLPAVILAHSGDSWFWLLGLGLVWLLGSPEWKFRTMVMAAGVVITAVLVLLIKFSVRRRRPEGAWGRIYRDTDPHSFPSGHAARAVMLAVVAQFLGPGWFSSVMIIWAPLVGLARITMGVHYLSDVIAGMALGGVLGLAVMQLF
ncbi:MAG TPA: phosphatase PAP2 family protein [Anaerolineales bacterium]